MDSLSRGQLASRLTLNCLDSYVEPQKLKDVYMTVMDVINTSFVIAGSAAVIISGVRRVCIVANGEGRIVQVLSRC